MLCENYVSVYYMTVFQYLQPSVVSILFGACQLIWFLLGFVLK